MFPELTRDRYRALELLADHIRYPSKDLILNAILKDISDEIPEGFGVKIDRS